MLTTPQADHEKQAQSRFDDWSESATFSRLRPWLMFVQDNLLREIDWSNARRVLDVACGSGWLVSQAAKRLPAGTNGAFACGCDLSEGMLRQRVSSGSHHPNACFMAASAQKIPLQRGTVDAVMCTAAFHHFPDPAGALREFKRVLRPGGLVLICDTCRDQSIGNWVWDRLHRWFEKGHVKYYKRSELLQLLREAGFDAVSVRDLNPSFAETKKLVRRTALFKAIAP